MSRLAEHHLGPRAVALLDCLNVHSHQDLQSVFSVHKWAILFASDLYKTSTVIAAPQAGAFSHIFPHWQAASILALAFAVPMRAALAADGVTRRLLAKKRGCACMQQCCLWPQACSCCACCSPSSLHKERAPWIMATMAQQLVVEVSTPLERQQVLYIAEAAGLLASVQARDASQLRLALPGGPEITSRNAVLRAIAQRSQKAAELLGGDKQADAQVLAV